MEEHGAVGGAHLFPHENVRLQMDKWREKKGTVSIVTIFRLSGCFFACSQFSGDVVSFLNSSHSFFFFSL